MFSAWKNNLRNIRRLEEVLQVFVQEGLGHYVLQTKLKRHLPWKTRFKGYVPLENIDALAIHLRHAFEKLGPTFVKLGQLLSLRPDLVPVEICKELEKLQDQVPPFTFEQAKAIIEEDLQKPLEKIFRQFDRKPLASASMAQIHKAVLISGKIVAVKVQRPGIKEIVDTDLDILFQVAKMVEKHFPQVACYRPVEIVKEFAIWTRRELNFEIEAISAKKLKDELKENKQVKVPAVYHSFSSRRCLTMDYIEGVKIDNLLSLKMYHLNRKKIAMTYFTSILEQALLHGFFHADPHPGNIFVQKNGKIVYLDYGIMGELNQLQRDSLIRFLLSLPEQNARKSFQILISLARLAPGAKLEEFTNATLPILEEVSKHSIAEKSMGHAIYEVISQGAKFGVLFDANLVLIAKAVYQAEGLGMKLYPEFKVIECFSLFSRQYLRKKYTPLAVLKKSAASFWSKKDLLLDLPEHLARLIERLEQPEPPHQLQIEQLTELEQEWEYLSRKRTMGTITIIFIIAAALLFYVEGRTQLFGFPLSIVLLILGLLCFTIFMIIQPKRRVIPHGTSD